MRTLFIIASASGALAACGGSKSAAGGDAGGVATQPSAISFHKEVEPILQRACQKCHHTGGIAPFSLLTYDDAKGVASSIVAQTKARTMPPWGAETTSECTPPVGFKDDQRLTDQEIATLEAWHQGGDIEGDPKDAPPPIALPTIELANATKLVPAHGFDPSVEPSTKDTLRCFVLDPGLTATRYLNGSYFVPKNKTLVHHAIAFAIEAGAKTPPERAGQAADTPYDCFGGPNAGERVSIVAAWAPGGMPIEFPPNVGAEVKAGTRIVLQVHYHPHANATKDADQTELQLRFMDAPPEWIATTQLIGNFDKPPALTSTGATIGLLPGPNDPSGDAGAAQFLIPRDATGHVETMTVTLPAILPELRVAGLAAHMHLVGRDQKVTVLRGGDPNQETCLLQVPRWNFDWQRAYTYDAPITELPIVKGLDEIRIRCTYDNVMTNRQLGAALLEAGYNSTVDVKLGESTTEEMCLAGFVFLRKAN